MILKGLYNTKVDRMTTAKYESYMFRVFGVMISEDLSSYKSKGFIMKNIWYSLYIPYIEDNKIYSFKHENMEYIGCYYGIINLKQRLKELIKTRPDYFKNLAQIMKGD